MKLLVGIAFGIFAVALTFFPDSVHLATDPYVWELPKGFPKPAVPADNPMTAEKVELGRHLFYDKSLSGNGTQSCAPCHAPEMSFANDLPVTNGSIGERGIRKSMSLVNVAYTGTLTWGIIKPPAGLARALLSSRRMPIEAINVTADKSTRTAAFWVDD